MADPEGGDPRPPRPPKQRRAAERVLDEVLGGTLGVADEVASEVVEEAARVTKKAGKTALDTARGLVATVLGNSQKRAALAEGGGERPGFTGVAVQNTSARATLHSINRIAGVANSSTTPNRPWSTELQMDNVGRVCRAIYTSDPYSQIYLSRELFYFAVALMVRRAGDNAKTFPLISEKISNRLLPGADGWNNVGTHDNEEWQIPKPGFLASEPYSVYTSLESKPGTYLGKGCVYLFVHGVQEPLRYPGVNAVTVAYPRLASARPLFGTIRTSCGQIDELVHSMTETKYELEVFLAMALRAGLVVQS